VAVQPPRPRLPPLGALRAFEAAARTGGFARAGAELNLSAAAIAQQVKLLEAWLGCPLFTRLPHGLRLTERGQAALPPLIAAFDALGDAVRGLTSAARPGQLAIAALPAIATLWLAPRLAAIRAAFPDIMVSITAMEAPPNLHREPYDLALFRIADADPVQGATRLQPDRITPVCSPAIAPDVREAAESWLRRQTLLHDSVWQTDWPDWLRVAGLDDIAPGDGPRFSLYGLAVQAAQQGAGVLIGHQALVAPALARGELIAPFARYAETGFSLAVMLPKQPTPQAARLADWCAAG
jgi:LysR family glycine cleavage system transcriptional activator